MKEKKRKSHLKKLLKKIKKEIELNAYSANPLNFISLRLHLISIVINFCGLSDNESHISIYPSSYCGVTDKLIQRVKPLIDVKIRNKLDGDVCSICNRFLDETKLFPDDFPNRFKICCYCKQVAEYIYNWDHPINSYIFPQEDFSKYYERYQEEFDNLFVIKQKGVII